MPAARGSRPGMHTARPLVHVSLDANDWKDDNGAAGVNRRTHGLAGPTPVFRETNHRAHGALMRGEAGCDSDAVAQSRSAVLPS